MKKRSIITLLLSCSFVVCLAAAITADINGSWLAKLKPGNGSEISVTYKFKTDGDKFTGEVDFPGSTFPVTDGVIRGDSIHFKVTLNGKGIPNDGKVYADSIALDIMIMGKKHHNTLTRVAP